MAANDFNQCGFISLYVDKKMSIREVAAIEGVPVSRMREQLRLAGVIRSPKDAQALAASKGKKGAHLIGKKRPASAQTREKMREGRARWAAANASGVSVKPSGYAEVTMGEHKGKRAHRVIVEQHIGRALLPSEVVHHIDGNKLNNNIENLAVMDATDHSRIHALERISQRARDKKGRLL